ncbi:hypothetical protein PPROV_001024400 [Pycnococcus provasolii]|uniref:Fcf2 pre-rRNA processing C-terminal domain-containing protein n=2 Tax=Pycnococcus provasolii TaxID=41880 RepID=A0A830HVT0_9CHLO|nr:hypothetical protein PPROV_001024400 [Pycnococcus provasolii]
MLERMDLALQAIVHRASLEVLGPQRTSSRVSASAAGTPTTDSDFAGDLENFAIVKDTSNVAELEKVARQLRWNPHKLASSAPSARVLDVRKRHQAQEAAAASLKKHGTAAANAAAGAPDSDSDDDSDDSNAAPTHARASESEETQRRNIVHAAIASNGQYLRKPGKARGNDDDTDTAGKNWFHMPAANMTPELKRDLQVLKLRGAYDPKRFYKGNDGKKLPKYFQMGTVVEGATDYGVPEARLTQRERKNTLAEEILHDANIAAYRKRKFQQLQSEKVPRKIKRGKVEAKKKKKHKKL